MRQTVNITSAPLTTTQPQPSNSPSSPPSLTHTHTYTFMKLCADVGATGPSDRSRHTTAEARRHTTQHNKLFNGQPWLASPFEQTDCFVLVVVRVDEVVAALCAAVR